MLGSHVSMWSRTRRLFSRDARALVVCSAALCLLSPGVHGEDLRRGAGPDLDVIELVINWDSLRNKTVSVDGRVGCDNENFCWFKGVPELSRVVSIDISNLHSPEKRRLVLGCHVKTCDLVVQGTVLADDIAASGIFEIEARVPGS
jgi:hypothetical protein